MKNISKDIQLGLDSVIEGLEFSVDIDTVEPEKIRTTMESKTVAFSVAKDMVTKWRKSRNAPTKKTVESYIKRIVEAGDSSIKVLRDALRKQIDYDGLDSSKHKSAIQAKPVIVGAIYEIEAGVFELRQQIETGSFNTEDDEFEVGYPEKFANGEMLNTSNYWKDWLNYDEDAINICPFSTKGEIIIIDDLKIQIPIPPEDKSKILFSDLPKEEQYWRRTPMPDGLSKQTKDQFTDYIYEEFRRRTEGVWFMNNGKKEYLTGTMYFSLQWGKMLDNGKYMNFRYAQREMFYFSEAVIRDDRCLGDVFVKSRRTGFTFEKIFGILNRSTSKKNWRSGITSKSDDDAKEAFSKYSYAFLNLPFFFRPVVRGNQESLVTLYFGKPSDMSKSGKKKGDLGMDKYLNSETDYKPTKNDSYDGFEINDYLGDEAGKWKKPSNYERHWGQISPALFQGGIVVGKAAIGSTVGAQKEGGAAFKKLEESSRLDKRDPITEMTPSGLYSHFLPAHKNMTSFTDIYGVCWESPFEGLKLNERGGKIKNVGSIRYLEAQAKAKRKEGDNQYNEFMRTFPMSKSDAYRDEMAQSDFNLVKIHEQRVFNGSLSREEWFRGNLQMIKEGDWSKGVKFVPKEDGKFVIFQIPPEELRNKSIMYNSKMYPANGMTWRGGVDSYDIDETVDGRASSGALHILSMDGVMSSEVSSNSFYLEYIERPPYAEMFYKDVFMAAVFFGSPLLIENNKKRIIEWGNAQGLRGYIMTRPKEFTPDSGMNSKVQKLMQGIPSNSVDVIQGHAHGIEKFIHYHVGEWSEVDEQMENENGATGYRQVGETGSMFMERTLEDWGLFNIKDRTKHDATISSGYAIMACNVKYKQKTVSTQKLDVSKLVRTYKLKDGRYR